MADFMKIFDNIAESFEWATMGEQEAASRITQREIKKSVAKQKSEIDTSGRYQLEGGKESYFNSIDDYHKEKHGTTLFGGPNKNMIRNAVNHFTDASMASSAMGQIFFDPEVMAAMDTWGFGADEVNQAMAGYSNDIANKGKQLINTITSMTGVHNGALSQKNGGPLTSEEAEHVLEALGNWSPEARLKLEMVNERGKVINEIESKYGDKFLDYTDMSTFGGGDPLISKLNEQDKNHVLTALGAVGEAQAVNALTAKWNGDDAYVNRLSNEFLTGVSNCQAQRGGFKYNPDGTPVQTPRKGGSFEWTKFESTKPNPVTGEAGPESGATAKGTGEFVGGGDLNVLASCFVSTPSPFGDGFNRFNVGLAKKMGLTVDHMVDQLRATEISEMLLDEEKGYLSYINNPNAAGSYASVASKNRGPITGIDISGELWKTDDMPNVISITNPEHLPMVAAAIQASDGDNRKVNWVTGDLAGRTTHIPDGWQPPTFRQKLVDLKYLSTDSNQFDFSYGKMKKAKFFNSIDDVLGVLPRVFKDELAAIPENQVYDKRRSISNKVATWRNEGSRMRTVDILNAWHQVDFHDYSQQEALRGT